MSAHNPHLAAVWNMAQFPHSLLRTDVWTKRQARKEDYYFSYTEPLEWGKVAQGFPASMRPSLMTVATFQLRAALEHLKKICGKILWALIDVVWQFSYFMRPLVPLNPLLSHELMPHSALTCTVVSAWEAEDIHSIQIVPPSTAVLGC